MASLISIVLTLFLHIPYLFLTTQIVESRLTKETLASAFGSHSFNNNTDPGTKWAVLIAGSQSYRNYRHQADVCHAYQILKRGGLKDENIIVFMYDDIAFNSKNPRQGVIINNPRGQDVYHGVPKDYTGRDVTASNFLAAILGNENGTTGGSGKVVNSGPNDHIFIYYADHGGPGILAMPAEDDDLYAHDLINTLKQKYEAGTYKSMVIYVEACESGSIFEGLLPKEWNIYVTTASNPTESSWAAYCPGTNDPPPHGYHTCLGDTYSVAWMEDSDSNDLQSRTLEQQYQEVKERTATESGSHVMEYGSLELSKGPLSLYMGLSDLSQSRSPSHVPLSAVEQPEADILYLQQQVGIAPKGSIERAEAEKELDEALSQRKHIDSTVQAIGKALFGAQGYESLNAVRSPGQPIVDDWDCFKQMAGTYKRHCGVLSSYGKKHMRIFANMCNAGLQPHQLAQASSQICVNNDKN